MANNSPCGYRQSTCSCISALYLFFRNRWKNAYWRIRSIFSPGCRNTQTFLGKLFLVLSIASVFSIRKLCPFVVSVQNCLVLETCAQNTPAILACLALPSAAWAVSVSRRRRRSSSWLVAGIWNSHRWRVGGVSRSSPAETHRVSPWFPSRCLEQRS